MGRRAEASFAYPPQLVFLLGLLQECDRRLVLGVPERMQHRLSASVDLGARVTAELHHQECLPLRKLLERDRVQPLDLFVVDQTLIDPLERDRFVGKDRWHRVGRLHDVGEAEYDESPLPYYG